MAKGRHVGFVNSAIRAMMVDIHLGLYNFVHLLIISDITPVSTDNIPRLYLRRLY